MDIEAEIRHLKLRVEALETSVRSAGAGGFRRRCRHKRAPARTCAHICMCAPARTCAHMQTVQADLSAALVAVAEVRADIADIQTAMSHDFTALGIGLAGLHWQTNEQVKSTRSEIITKLDSLQCEMLDLGLRIDRLLEKGDM
ncbi:hypothetical protein ACTMTI_08225 [Nonomuraea sp. H19]|uniref:hypothetical protein n=1 Tax=Nonomuraea sp. H19 TaxID=3452206 RepID=UPI003F8AB9D0